MTIVLVQCGRTKLSKPARAEDLYIGNLFVQARSAARRLGGSWFILSAKYGLLAPHRIIAPYDQKLSRKGDPEWGALVLVALRAEIEKVGATRIVALCAASYCGGWAAEVGAELPLKGLAIGKQLRELKGMS
jgi:uncharacterized protein DUF6884